MWTRNLVKSLGVKQKLQPLLLSRLHSTLVIRDLYKQTGYKAPFNPDDSARILECINKAELSSDFIPKNLVPKVTQHIAICGPFKVVEELLDVKGVEPKRLERICNTILKAKARTAGAESKKVDFTRWISPAISPDVSYPSVVGFKINLNHISASKIRGRDVEEWTQIVPSKHFKDDKDFFEHQVLLEMAKEIVTEMPKGDAYVFEIPSRIFAKDSVMDIKYKTMVFQTAILSFLDAAQNSDKAVRLYSMKPQVVSKMFSTSVGTERTLTQQRIKDHLEPFGIQVQDHQWERLWNLPKVIEKEQMCEALLISLAFSHILHNI